MKTVTTYFYLSIAVILLSTCKKKTTVHVKLLNPALNEYVANATIVLVEKKGEAGGGLFIGNVSCKEIATAVTNANGEAVFDKEKLRRATKYNYFFAVKESWGLAQSYPCGSKASGFLTKGKTQEVLLTDYIETYVKMQYNNVFNPGMSGDSLKCSVEQSLYYDPVSGGTQGGGGIGGISIDYNTYYPFPSVSVTSPVKIYANRLIVSIRKRKMGVVTTSLDTIKAYPNQTTVVQVNW